MTLVSLLLGVTLGVLVIMVIVGILTISFKIHIRKVLKNLKPTFRIIFNDNQECDISKATEYLELTNSISNKTKDLI